MELLLFMFLSFVPITKFEKKLATLPLQLVTFDNSSYEFALWVYG